MDLEDIAGKGSKGKEERIFKNWRKGSLCYILTENLVKLSPAVIWEEELKYRTCYIAKEISKQSIKNATLIASCCLQ